MAKKQIITTAKVSRAQRPCRADEDSCPQDGRFPLLFLEVPWFWDAQGLSCLCHQKWNLNQQGLTAALPAGGYRGARHSGRVHPPSRALKDSRTQEGWGLSRRKRKEKTHKRCTISLDYVLGKGSRRNGFVSHYGGHCYLLLAVLDLCKESACKAGDIGSIPGLGRSPGEGNADTLQYSWPGKSHGQRSLAGYSPWGCKESTRLSDWHTHMGGIRGSFLEEVALQQGHQELVHCWQRKEQSEGTAKAKARRQESGSLLYILVAEATFGEWRQKRGDVHHYQATRGCPLPVLYSEFSHRESSKGREVPGTRSATAL